MAPNEKAALAGPSRPLGLPDIPQFFLPAARSKGVYAPRLYGAARIHFADRKRKVDETRPASFLVPLEPATKTIDWDASQPSSVTPEQLLKDAPASAKYQPLPSGAMEVKSFTRWAKGFDRWLARTQRLDLPVNPEAPEPASIGPKRGGVSVELVAIVWELT